MHLISDYISMIDILYWIIRYLYYSVSIYNLWIFFY